MPETNTGTPLPQSAAPASASPQIPAAPPPSGESIPGAATPEGSVPAGADAGATPLLPAGELPSDGLIAAGLPHDLSPWSMFEAAHPVVQGVMILLALASVVTWALYIAKTIEIARAMRRVAHVREVLRDRKTLAEAVMALGEKDGPERVLVHAAMGEAHLSGRLKNGGAGLKERIAIQSERLELVAGRRMTRGMGALATIGSVSPFVGLFGTVWGIMNSFVGIARAQTTNLAVVAPGIAEALLATAIGLAAAIPAVVIYNHFTRQIGGYRLELGNASADVNRMVSRDLDHDALPLAKAAE